MTRHVLANDRDRAEWLQCLQAGASLGAVLLAARTKAATEELTWEQVGAITDGLYAEFLKRCGE